MKQSLQLKLGQQLTMTPQLQQAIRLLQLSSLDLQQEIQDALDSNPLLETDAEDEPHSESLDDFQQQEGDNSTADSSDMETSDALGQQDIPQDLPTDSSWDDVYSASTAPAKGSVSSDEDYVYQGETSESLQDYLIWQMQLSHFSDEDEAIAQAIIDAVDDAGYLTIDLDEVQAAVQKDYPEVTDAEVCMVLKRVQRFDPVGVAARSVSECLLIQLTQLPEDTPMRAETMMVIRDHLDLLASRDYRTLARKSKLKEDQLREVMRLMHRLHPRPGETVVQRESEYVIPDVSVFKHQGRWVVELNPDSVPKLRVNEEYAALSKQAKRSEDSDYIKQHMQDARWFIKSIESRNETLLKVTNAIVHRQQAFFEQGEEAMKPMVLNDIADAIDMHESTVSRVTTQKFMHTPRGIFELKYFFSSHVSTEDGGECSSTAIRALIRKLVATENPAKPLSDSKIAELMAEQGIQVARRTIAKYRESLNIPPSNQRKSLL
ncbi:RNA polymerase factor sigma-54 [Aliidiomarina soli]|uniref:RNA polymerase sigma-54 factor n=1 Tax=Aliidiomarina soli TaxID=1928574 RepID=A0A432WJS7_9GAMM|nr:RNA polymerase factor sigma-54 [Aliidiomarina soli]RUO34024.1 RNA polymerase factor sigma-54 [Aliidiomarina soli]